MLLFFSRLDHFPLEWIDASKDCLPQNNPVIGGIDSNGTPFFVCSVEQGHRVVGLVSFRKKKCGNSN